jgi:hypothetical protein
MRRAFTNFSSRCGFVAVLESRCEAAYDQVTPLSSGLRISVMCSTPLPLVGAINFEARMTPASEAALKKP